MNALLVPMSKQIAVKLAPLGKQLALTLAPMALQVITDYFTKDAKKKKKDGS